MNTDQTNDDLPVNGMAYRYIGERDKESLADLIHYYVGKDPTGSSWIFVGKIPGVAKLHWMGFPQEYERWPEHDLCRAQPVADDAAMPDEIIAYIDTRFSEPHQHSWITKNDNPDALSDRPHAKYIRAALRQPAAADNREDTTYLISVLTDIREKTGVGSKPMLSELADAIVQKYAADNRGVDVEAWEQIDMDMDVLKDCIPNRQDRETFLTSIHNRVKAIIQKAKS